LVREFERFEVEWEFGNLAEKGVKVRKTMEGCEVKRDDVREPVE
jgi:hypothetical protein